jgi:hypothetical protein
MNDVNRFERRTLGALDGLRNPRPAGRHNKPAGAVLESNVLSLRAGVQSIHAGFCRVRPRRV